MYFHRARALVEAADPGARATYAVFMRRPILAATRLALDWLRAAAAERGEALEIEERFEEGQWVGAGEPLLWITGRFAALVDLETLLLQKIGPPCVAAHNAWRIARALPQVEFLAMDARHCAGVEMAGMMAYAAFVGSEAARRSDGAKGFAGSSTDGGAAAFGAARGLGTMPHAVVGWAGSTLAAAEACDRAWPDEPMTVLVDYFGREVSDSLAVARRFPGRVARGDLSVRIDIPGSRYMEGLDPGSSYETLERRAPEALRRYLNEEQQRFLVGPGTTAAAVWRLREALDEAGFEGVGIVASSGFGPEKCEALALARVPLARVGTGSFLPERWAETYATADVVEYDGVERVKQGREFLLPSRARGRR